MTDSAPAPCACAVIGGGPAGLIAALALAHFGVPAVAGRQAADADRQPHHGAAGEFGRRARGARRMGGLPGLCRAASGDAHRRRHRAAVARTGSAVRGRRDRASRVRLEYREPASCRRAVEPRGGGQRAHPNRFRRAIDRDRIPRASPSSPPRVRPYGPNSWSAPMAATRSAGSPPGSRWRSATTPRSRSPIFSATPGLIDDISTEFHTGAGPFTVVPLPGPRSSLVCVVAPVQAESLAGLRGAALDAEIERRCHSILGKVHVEPGHGAFPLMVATAQPVAAAASPWSARPPMCFRRSAPRGSISGCGMPSPSRRSPAMPSAMAAISAAAA